MMRPVARMLAITIAASSFGIVERAHSADASALINRDLVFRTEILDQRAPDAVQRLITNKDAVITFVGDLAKEHGKTHFFMNVDWKFDYKYRTRTQANSVEVTLEASNIRVECKTRHIVRMPLAYHRVDVWQTQLLLHELDHVAVSGDDRVQMLLEALCSNLPPITTKLMSGTKPSDKFCVAAISQEINRRRNAVIELARANYVLLDKLTEHGQRPVPNRLRFFAGLYTERNLEQNRFPFAKEVATLLESEEYRAVKPPNLATDPTAP